MVSFGESSYLKQTFDPFGYFAITCFIVFSVPMQLDFPFINSPSNSKDTMMRGKQGLSSPSSHVSVLTFSTILSASFHVE